jgi:hypothetical protein
VHPARAALIEPRADARIVQRLDRNALHMPDRVRDLFAHEVMIAGHEVLQRRA